MKKTYLYIGIGVVALGIIGALIWKGGSAPRYTHEAGQRPYRGNSQASILVEEFADFQCPACRYASQYLPAIEQKYGYQVKFSFRHFPLTTIHQYALRAAVASECANDQGKFWEYHDELFARQADLSNALLPEIANTLGLDMASFNACLDDKARLDIVRADMAEGDRRGVNATPTFLVNGEKTDLGQLPAKLDSLLK